jgi:hypothetical protein
MSKNIVFLNTTSYAPITTIEKVNGKWVSKTYGSIYSMPGDMRRRYQIQHPACRRVFSR